MESKTFKNFCTLLSIASIIFVTTSCTKKLLDEDASLTVDSYTAGFYANLVSAGMSASDAAFVSGCSECSSGATLSANLSANVKFESVKALSAAELQNKAKASVNAAMTAVSDDSYFADAASKQAAIKQISQAQLVTLAALSEDADLSDNIYEVSASLASDTEYSGLTGSDLQSALEEQGKGVAKGVIEDVDSAKHSDVTNSFSKGAVDGLFNNPNLASSGVDLIASLTQGLLNEVGSESGGVLTGAGKGLIIKEILGGVKTQINGRSDLTDDNKEGYVNGIWDKGSSVINDIGDSTIGSAIKDGLFSNNQELHIVSIYEPITSSAGDATIDIATGTKPIVLALISYRATTWHFTGATERISKIITHGVNSNTLDLGSLNPEVEVIAKDTSYASFYGIRPASGFYYDITSPWTKALSVKLRQKTGFHVTSFQGAYTQNAFTVGDGNNDPGKFPSLTLSRPWLYSFDYRGVKSYQASGTARVDVILWLTSTLSSSLSVRVWVENVTTTTADIPAFDTTYTINAGSPYLQVIIPFNQNNAITDTRTFKVHIESTGHVLNYQKVIDGSLIGSSGATNLGTSGYNSGTWLPILLL